MANEAAIAALQKIMQAVEELQQVPSRVSRAGSERIQTLIAQQFVAQTDPYGNAWAPHKPSTVKELGSHSILSLTGALSNVEVKPMSGAGIQITLGASYGAFHQTGTRNMAARPILPNAGLPDSWSAALEASSAEEFDKIMGGK